MLGLPLGGAGHTPVGFTRSLRDGNKYVVGLSVAVASHFTECRSSYGSSFSVDFYRATGCISAITSCRPQSISPSVCNTRVGLEAAKDIRLFLS